MARRASKAGREVAGPPEIDSVGLTILPGHPLPAWAGGEELAATDPTAVPTDADAWPPDAAWGPPDAWATEVEAHAGTATAQAPALGDPVQDAAQAQAPAMDAAWAAAAAPAYAAQPVPAMAGASAAGWQGAPGSPSGTAAASGYPGSVATAPGGFSSTGGFPSTTGVPGVGGVPSAQGGYPSGHPGGPAGYPSAAAGYAPGAPTLPGPREAHPTMMGAAGTTATAWPEAPTPPAPAAPPVGPAPGHVTQPGPTQAGPGSAAAPAHHASTHPAASGVPAAPDAAGPAPSPVTPDAAPSDVWTSQQRPELTPEHVALLTWWAEMISKGQFPGPVPAAAAPPSASRRGLGRRRVAKQAVPTPVAAVAPTASSAPAEPPAPPAPAGPAAAGAGSTPSGTRGRSHRLLVGLAAGACGVALVGAAVLVGPALLGSGEAAPAAVPATDLVMPASVGDLVPLDAATAGDALTPVLGLGLRPSGVTVTQAYGTSPEGPMVLAALGSTAPVRTDAVGQILTWEQSTGATVGESVTGDGATAGITCAPVAEVPSAPAGSVCIWGDQVLRGQTYAAGADPAAAMALTAQLRSGVTPAPQP